MFNLPVTYILPRSCIFALAVENIDRLAIPPYQEHSLHCCADLPMWRFHSSLPGYMSMHDIDVDVQMMINHSDLTVSHKVHYEDRACS